MSKSNYIAFFIFISFMSFGFFSCTDEEDFDTSSSAKLEFSTNEILFDTVFTTIGSTTKTIMVYNKGNKPVNVSRIRICGGTASAFRINADGAVSEIINNIEIAANDSMYLFAKVTINPSIATTPFIVKDSIEFSLNNERQYLPLTAFGQNAIFHYPNQTRQFNGKTLDYSYANCSQNWDNILPHVIYGNCLVDSDSTLTIEEGTKVYFYNKSALLVNTGASLKVKGNHQNPVIFQSMRLDGHYKDLPGQWDRIHFIQGSKDNEIDWAIIRNGTIGIDVDSVVNQNATLKISNTIIENMSDIGIMANNTTIQASNVVVANCQNNVLKVTKGGSYSFIQCTFANYWNYDSRSGKSIFLSNISDNENYPLSAFKSTELGTAIFGNCIVYGTLNEELKIDVNVSNVTNHLFSYCLLKTQEEQKQALYDHCFVNSDPKFINPDVNDYHIGSSSAAIGKGTYYYGNLIPQDLDDNDRSSPPSLGAYEYTGSSSKKR